ncbi:MAG: hypothetical protein AABW59_04475 [archaeon]
MSPSISAARQQIESRIKRLRIQKRLLERKTPILEGHYAQYARRLKGLQAHPESHSKATNYIDIHYYTTKKGEYKQRPYDMLRERNRQKAEIVKKLAARMSESQTKNNDAILDARRKTYDLEEKLIKLDKRLGLLAKARRARKDINAQNKRFSTQLSDPKVFDEYTEKVSWELYRFFRNKKIRLPYFERDKYILERSSPELSSTRALGAIFGQIARESKTIPLKDFTEEFPAMLRKQGIKSVLEIGPGGTGVIDLLINSGIAGKAGLMISAIDTHLSEERISELKEKKVEVVHKNAKNISGEFNGKKFDLIIGVGVLGAGGLSGQTFQDNAISFSLDSHKIAKSAVEALSSNKNAMFCAAPIFGLTTLRQRAVERFAKIAQWSPLTQKNVERAEGTLFRMRPPMMTRGVGMVNARESVDAHFDWMERNRQYYDYGTKLISGAPSLVILKRK